MAAVEKANRRSPSVSFSVIFGSSVVPSLATQNGNRCLQCNLISTESLGHTEQGLFRTQLALHVEQEGAYSRDNHLSSQMVTRLFHAQARPLNALLSWAERASPDASKGSALRWRGKKRGGKKPSPEVCCSHHCE